LYGRHGCVEMFASQECSNQLSSGSVSGCCGCFVSALVASCKSVNVESRLLVGNFSATPNHVRARISTFSVLASLHPAIRLSLLNGAYRLLLAPRHFNHAAATRRNPGQQISTLYQPSVTHYNRLHGPNSKSTNRRKRIFHLRLG
jgi:hypothetical protein